MLVKTEKTISINMIYIHVKCLCMRYTLLKETHVIYINKLTLYLRF